MESTVSSRQGVTGLVDLLDMYARAEIDITARGNILINFAGRLDEVRARSKSALRCNEFVEQVCKQYGEYGSELLQADFEILAQLQVDPEFAEMHGIFIEYVESAIAVEQAAPDFFGSYSFTDRSTANSRLRALPNVAIDGQLMLSFKQKQTECNVAVSAWNDQWRQLVKRHNGELRNPKSWQAYVLRVRKLIEKEYKIKNPQKW